ncbi:cyclase family protein [Herbivorax sp. ANBcel31]|uniref:cyclase family protein n=1 Tax=Herbivorax sp. ANBcel31 TaxID=3069754 RepID=UPI0027AFC0D8|nr:cyclase family protein [Herbivorax sp. ANBcel31]MDQ2085194.1 cyclase family protein [Herbivorax sp. ANBcel31]
MEIYDVSMAIHKNMPVYKNIESKRPFLKRVKSFEEDGINESEINMNLHTGTHIDAPLHVFKDGDSIEKIDIKKLITKCKVLDLTGIKMVTEDELKVKEIEKESFVILKTDNSYRDEFNAEFVFLEKSGAKYLADLNIKGVGIDALGIERGQIGHPTHNTIINNGAIIIEGLRLKEIKEGEYMMYALPLNIVGGDGAPARVILTK